MMFSSSLHNPDRFMSDLRQIVSQGRKRIGLFLGAGTPTSLRVGSDGELHADGEQLIPDVAGLTKFVVDSFSGTDQAVIEQICTTLGKDANIEAILTKIRKLSHVIGGEKIYGYDASQYATLAQSICTTIGEKVGARLPKAPNPYSELVSWISGIHRSHAVEIFTSNYDLLLEEAFERAQVAYFDGFTGSAKPFFDPVSISSSLELPVRWGRIWKLHGSLGWEVSGDTVVRTGNRNATSLIYPDHLKYDQVTRLPYSALFERLRVFLSTPDTLLICSGFSFLDSHICAVFDECLAGNAHSAILAFQFKSLAEEQAAQKLAFKRPNLSVYARDGAVISGVAGRWVPGEPPNDEWRSIRRTFWNAPSDEVPAEFVLGDFAQLARFFALAQADRMASQIVDQPESSKELPATEPGHNNASD